MGKLCGEDAKVDPNQVGSCWQYQAIESSTYDEVSYFSIQGNLQKPTKSIARILPTT